MSFDSWRPFISKILSPLVVAFFYWIGKKTGIVYTPDTVQEAVEFLVGIIMPAVGLLAVVINKHVNPGNAASSHLALQEKREVAEIKATTDQYKAMK